MNLNNNTILITGGTSGIGLAFAEQFMAAGSKVIICGRRAERLKELSARFPDLVTYECDVSNQEDRKALIIWAINNYPQLNVLINNAGIQLDNNLTKPIDSQRVASELEINFIAPLHLASLITQHLSAQNNAVIINVSSGLAFAPIAFMPVYCASKAALHSATLSLRHQLHHLNIKVFEVIPPSVDTELGHQRREDETQSHGGMPVAEFITAAMKGLEDDILELAVGQSIGLRQNREVLFEQMNPMPVTQLPVNHEQ